MSTEKVEKRLGRSKFAILLIIGFLALITYLLITVSNQLSSDSVSTESDASEGTRGFAAQRAQELVAETKESSHTSTKGVTVTVPEYNTEGFCGTYAIIECPTGETTTVTAEFCMEEYDWRAFGEYECFENPNPGTTTEFLEDIPYFE